MSDINDAEEYMNDPSVNAAREDADEIERLRGIIETQGRDHDSETCTMGSLCPWCEIERLRERIEDLECEVSFKRAEHFDRSCEWFKDKKIITFAQINEAWGWYPEGPFKRLIPQTLAKLGIEPDGAGWKITEQGD